jgi:hypothetical protein
MVSRAPAAEPGSPPSARDAGVNTETLQRSATVGGGSLRQQNGPQTTVSRQPLVAGPAPLNLTTETSGTDNGRVLDTSNFGAHGLPAEPPNDSQISAASTPHTVVHRSTSDPVPAASPSAPTKTFQWGELSRNEEPETSGNNSPPPSALGDEGTDYGEVADQVYDRIERRLRYELLTDLERRGQLTRWR